MERTVRRVMVLVLCAALTATGLAAACHAGHDCEGEGCPICLMIQGTIRFAALCPAAVVLSAFALRTARRLAPAARRARCSSSLVDMKTELLS